MKTEPLVIGDLIATIPVIQGEWALESAFQDWQAQLRRKAESE